VNLISQGENGRISWPKIRIIHVSKLHLINFLLDIIMSKLDKIVRVSSYAHRD